MSLDLHSGSSDPLPPLLWNILMIGLFWQDHLGPSLAVARLGVPSKESQLGADLCHFRIDLAPRLPAPDLQSLNQTTKCLLLLGSQYSLLSDGTYYNISWVFLKVNFHV